VPAFSLPRGLDEELERQYAVGADRQPVVARADRRRLPPLKSLRQLACRRPTVDDPAHWSPVLPHIAPMLATLVSEPFHRDGWVYEEKVDGWRIADGSRVRLVSRVGRDDHAGRFSEIAETAAGSRRPPLILRRRERRHRCEDRAPRRPEPGSGVSVIEKGIRSVGISPAATQVST
jgi:ATP-dependent DNA ligase